jgi:hypothetical protein
MNNDQSTLDRGSVRPLATLVTGALALIAVLAFGLAGTSSAAVTSTSGGAFGEKVNVALLPLGLPVSSGPLPTVTLPSNGGSDSRSLLSVAVPNLLSTGLLQVSTSGTTGETGAVTSSASVANVNALNGVLRATAISSTCRSDSSGSTASSSLLNAVLDPPGDTAPFALPANPGPNMVVLDIPGQITVTLNEQSETEQEFSSSTKVSAVHIRLPGGIIGTGDIYIAQSRCGVAGPNVNTTTSTSTTAAPTTSAPTTSSTTTTTVATGKCNSGGGNGSEPNPPTDCDPGKSGGGPGKGND